LSSFRTLLTKRGGHLGSSSVAWQFTSKGVIRITADQLTGKDKDTLELAAIEAGADDVQDDVEGVTMTCPPTDLHTLQAFIENQGLKLASADVELVPNTPLTLTPDDDEKLQRVVEALEEHDDVTAVWTNAK
jgi:transcriptional/translational regulatory protein YebC/TACO1